MMQEAGWVEIIDKGAARMLARGHLLVDDVRVADGSWCGHLDSIRRAPGAPALAEGDYVLRFSRTAEQRLARFEIRRNSVRVCGDDGVVPAVVSELAEGT